MSAALIALVLALGCVPTRGGWDIGALRRERPAIAAIEGERLGDLVPFPALALAPAGTDGAAPERVALVACRFAAASRIRVRAHGPGWSEEVGDKVLAAIAAQTASFGLRLDRVASGAAEIGIEAFTAEGPELPEGLGDALVECDVAPHAQSAARGRILRAEIRMRRSGRDAAGRVRIASDEAWAGALLHELGHALGFAGHVAAGNSILVRDEFKLRAFGRRVLRDESFDDATLRAFHALAPGQALGSRQLRESDAVWVRAVRRLDRAWVAAGAERLAVVATVGDREARWSLRYADGRRLGLRFPGWPERLREGSELLVLPDRETLAVIGSSLRTVTDERRGGPERGPEDGD